MSYRSTDDQTASAQIELRQGLLGSDRLYSWGSSVGLRTRQASPSEVWGPATRRRPAAPDPTPTVRFARTLSREIIYILLRTAWQRIAPRLQLYPPKWKKATWSLAVNNYSTGTYLNLCATPKRRKESKQVRAYVNAHIALALEGTHILCSDARH